MKFEHQMNSLAAQQLEAFKIEVRLEFESLASFIWFWAQIENSIAERTQNTRICRISRPKTMLDANKLRVTREVAPHISLKLWLVKNSSQVPNQSHRPFFRHMHHRLPPQKTTMVGDIFCTWPESIFSKCVCRWASNTFLKVRECERIMNTSQMPLCLRSTGLKWLVFLIGSLD